MIVKYDRLRIFFFIYGNFPKIIEVTLNLKTNNQGF
jgi:hypothetical protein